MSKQLSTDSYKGVRDFYPDDMAVQRYIFDIWSQTAESFGFERYDASVLEPSELYKAKGAENEEMVNEQTYTFTDRGDREVTLRPEMTPTVARMIAGKRRELTFPVRWYSIPNLFRYERMQRGRLREHWQLNCDIFGAEDYTADVEIIALAHQLLINFGADESMFEIRVNNRAEMQKTLLELGVKTPEDVTAITRLNDRKAKIEEAEYVDGLTSILSDPELASKVKAYVESNDATGNNVLEGLQALGINNAVLDRSIARGFDYYTGTIFEIFDKHPDGTKRSMLGGGRYDNLTALFGGEPITGIGFGMGDVTMRDFLETHNLLTANLTAPTVMVIPMQSELNLDGQKIAQQIRTAGISVATDISTKKVGKKVSAAAEAMVGYVLVVGEDELTKQQFTVKNLTEETEVSGTLEELIAQIS